MKAKPPIGTWIAFNGVITRDGSENIDGVEPADTMQTMWIGKVLSYMDQMMNCHCTMVQDEVSQ